jgi:hypothetical protein
VERDEMAGEGGPAFDFLVKCSAPG